MKGSKKSKSSTDKGRSSTTETEPSQSEKTNRPKIRLVKEGVIPPRPKKARPSTGR